jgi:hypothetical protein
MSMLEETSKKNFSVLITADAILSAIVLLFLDNHVLAWDKNVENYGFYSPTIFISILLYIGCVFTLFRSIVLVFQGLSSSSQYQSQRLFKTAYNLFLIVLFAIAFGILLALLSVLRQAIYAIPHIPVQIQIAPGYFLLMLLPLLLYSWTLVIYPEFISGLVEKIKVFLRQHIT